ncbi:hypothetical protein MVEG_10614 [Podila verticillata NRRL 6337]|nr:hypothetical protein MVEG_10614 [Podila verticillata NRRL 6337]
MNIKPKPKPKPLSISAEFNHQAFVTSKKTLKVTLGQNVEPAREKPVAEKTSVKEVTKKGLPGALSQSRCLSLSQCPLLFRSSSLSSSTPNQFLSMVLCITTMLAAPTATAMYLHQPLLLRSGKGIGCVALERSASQEPACKGHRPSKSRR